MEYLVKYLKKEINDAALWTKLDDEILKEGDNSPYFSKLEETKGREGVRRRKRFLGLV